MPRLSRRPARASTPRKLADPDFWSVVGQTELRLYKTLAGDGQLATARDSIELGFQDLHKRVSAAWMWASVYDNARFVLHKYAARGEGKEGKAAAALLERLATFARPEASATRRTSLSLSNG